MSAEPETSHVDGQLPPEIIDMEIFGQLLEMDEEDDRDFSKSIVWNYFEQAVTTFGQMDKALKEEDLGELSQLGHFLKGSSAACGVIKVRDSCEYMQHYGKQKDEKAVAELSREVALEKLKTTLTAVKEQYKEAEKALRKFYAEEGDEEAPEKDASKEDASETPAKDD